MAAGGAALSPFAVVLGVALASAGSGTLDPQTVLAAAAASALHSQPCSTSGPVTVGTDFGDGKTMDSYQISMGQTLYTVSQDAKMPEQAAVIAISAAIERSHLQNYAGGSDFLGYSLFNLSPGSWGTAAQLNDPVYVATQFYTRLAQVQGWQSLPLEQAATEVLRLPDPSRYNFAQWEPIAKRLVATYDGTAGTCSGTGGNGSTGGGTIPLPPGFTLPADTPAAARTAVSWALAQLGTPYSYGGSCSNSHDGNPADQCDCSSLVMMAYRAAGITIPRGSIAQSGVGTPIYSVDKLLPGDLIFIPGDDGTPEAPGHVGMYIGQGLLVEAPHTGLNVQISPVAGYWQGQISAMRRMVN
jgi:cell wall-associated NlpC family hydrolase